jgi:RNA polymerase sigma-70 factor (ECF subfamily)
VEDRSQPGVEVERRKLLAALRSALADVLTAHQRRVPVALALNGVPIDVVAEHLGATRGALYKTLHDARQKRCAELGEHELTSA